MLQPPQLLSPGQTIGGQQNSSQLAAALMGRAQMPQLQTPSFGGGMSLGSLAQILKQKQQQTPNGQPIINGPQAMIGASQSDPYQAINSYNYADNPSMWSQIMSGMSGMFNSGGGSQ